MISRTNRLRTATSRDSAKPNRHRTWRRFSGCVLSAVIVLAATAAHAAPSVGTAFNGPHNIPGVVQGEDFNAGTNGGAYIAITPGNQGNSTYRPGVDVDVYDEAGITYASTSKIADKTRTEWLNYTIQATQSGWYRISVRVRTNPTNLLISLLNDRALGGSNWIVAETGFNEVVMVPRVYINAGTHVFKLAFQQLNREAHIDTLTFEVIDPPVIADPKLVETATDVFVADAIVTDAPFFADSSGQTDATGAIQAALDIVAELGGGTVFLPAGMYRLDGELNVPGNVTMVGDWTSPEAGGLGSGTILLAYQAPVADDAASETAPPLISMADEGIPTATNACIRNLSIWYPEQMPDDIQPYPYAIRANHSHSCSVQNITFYNAYNAVKYDHSSGIIVSGLYGTVLKRGYEGGKGLEYSPFSQVHFDPRFWIDAPASVITNAPQTQAQIDALYAYVSENLDGVRIGQNDAMHIYDVAVPHAQRAVVIGQIPGDDWSYYGIMSKIEGEVFDVGETHRIDGVLHYQHTDKVAALQGQSYEFPVLPRAARTHGAALYNVLEYGAAGDGSANDQPAIQAALDAAGADGGGVVYLPSGLYRIDTHLNVPGGVELRGACGYRPIGIFKETCVLHAYEGHNTANPETAPALITLAANAGVRGLTITYPNQGYTSPAEPIVPYPYAVRGTGAGVWVADVNFMQTYNTIDLATYRCDNHVISQIWITPLHYGITVGGGSTGGCLQKMNMSYGVNIYSLAQNGPSAQGYFDEYLDHSLLNIFAYRFGHCRNQRAFSICSWMPWVGLHCFTEPGGVCEDAWLWHVGGEASEDVAFRFNAGDNIHIIGPSRGNGGQLTGQPEIWLRTEASFTGTVHIYDKMLWGNVPGQGLTFNGGTVLMHNDDTLVTGKSVTASGSLNSGTGPEKAFDGDEFTKWACNTPDKWLMVDLGQPCEIKRWHLKNAGVNPAESSAYNTAAANLAYGMDGVSFATADSFSGNARHFVDRGFTPRQARYIKMTVTQATQNGSDQIARIPELLVYGREGWHFAGDAQGWTAQGHIGSVTVADDRMMLDVTGAYPTLLSPDNLNVDLGRYRSVGLRLRNGTPAVTARLYFTTTADTLWDTAKSVTIDLIAADAQFREYVFDFADVAGWAGTCKQLKLIIDGGPGTIDIDNIAFIEAGAPLSTDVNNDSIVDYTDLAQMAGQWLSGQK